MKTLIEVSQIAYEIKPKLNNFYSIDTKFYTELDCNVCQRILASEGEFAHFQDHRFAKLPFFPILKEICKLQFFSANFQRILEIPKVEKSYIFPLSEILMTF